jgi:hypothetical protein
MYIHTLFSLLPPHMAGGGVGMYMPFQNVTFHAAGLPATIREAADFLLRYRKRKTLQ